MNSPLIGKFATLVSEVRFEGVGEFSSYCPNCTCSSCTQQRETEIVKAGESVRIIYMRRDGETVGVKPALAADTYPFVGQTSLQDLRDLRETI